MDIGGVECFIMDMHVMLPKRTATMGTGGVAMLYNVHACNVAIFDE